MEYRLAGEVVRLDFAAIEDDDDKYIARQIYLTEIEKSLNILTEIQKEKPILYAITMTNISERSETEVKTCVDFDIYSAAKDTLPLFCTLLRLINWLQLVLL